MNIPSFRVVTIGNICTGKSTLLNALLGEVLLPAGVVASFDCPVNIRYGEEPNAIIILEGEELKVNIGDIRKYAVDKDVKKVIIECPIKFCNFDFVDTPGLCWSTWHNDIITEYLPSANTIIYCMRVQNAFSISDKAQIEHLRELGYKSIIFVLTYYDLLLYNDEMYGTNETDKTRAYYIEKLSRYTDLKETGVFFVGSLPALNTKLNKNDASMVCSSHLLELENRLKELYAKWQLLH